MNSALLNPENCSILIIEPTPSIKQMMSAAFRSLGYKKFCYAANGRDALHVLGFEKVDWIITPLLANESVNAIHLLKVICEEPSLKHMRLSLFIASAEETFCLPLAFELGLLSFHERSTVKDVIIEEAREILDAIKRHNSNEVLASAEFARTGLERLNLRRSRLSLEEALLGSYPGNPRVIVGLAEAFLLNEKPDRGAVALKQAELIDPKLRSDIENIRHKFPSETSQVSEQPVPGINALGIAKVVIVDPDSDVLHHLEELLLAAGVKTVAVFEDAAKALEQINAKDAPDLVICEWRTLGMSAPIFIQRLRSSGLAHIPIVVISSLVRSDDLPLLKEMGVDDVLQKPFDGPSFFKTTIRTLQQNRIPTEQRALHTKIERLISVKKLGEANSLVRQYVASDKVSAGAKKEVQAMYEYALNNFEKSHKTALEALAEGEETLFLFNLLGKTTLQLKRYEEALGYFERANAISSKNVERLLAVSDIHMELGNLDKAEKALDAASALDASNPLVKESEAKLAFDKGNMQECQRVMEQLDSGSRILSFMNNRAVALARSQKFEDAFSLYKKAIESVPQKWPDTKLSLNYNLGLSYARADNLPMAKDVLAQIKSNSPVGWKSKSLLQRIEKCLAQGTKLRFQPDDEEATSQSHAKPKDEPSLEDLREAMPARRGDICCHLFFRVVEDYDPKALALAENTPRFVRTSSIDRN